MSRHSGTSRRLLALATITAALAVHAIAAEVTRLEGRRAEYRERVEDYTREAECLEASAQAAIDAEARMRLCEERLRRGAEECLRNAGREAPGFVRDLWNERADDFRREANRTGLEADALAGSAAAKRESAAAMLRSAARYEALIDDSIPEILP